jgi:inosine-uridine nucleoside N-ribohydrolase
MSRFSSFKRLSLSLFSTVLAALIAFAPFQPMVSAAANPVKIVIDADTGVDDAAAIAYLLSQNTSQVNILGITAVAGNTSVENAANNALILLDVAQRTDIPVVIGASGPLNLPASHQGQYVHGPDGLWFVGYSFPHDLSTLPTDAPAFLRDQAVANPGATLLALGPLTNIARAVQQYPSEMALYSRVIWVGGAKVVQPGDGNTPVSVFNPWFDPEAAQMVLDSGLPMIMVTTDAARTVTVTERDIDKLSRRGTALGKFIAPILQAYSDAINQSANQSTSTERFTASGSNRNGHRNNHANRITIPLFDPAAAVLALKPEWATQQLSSLVFVQTPDGVARGQTIIGLSLTDRIQMLGSDAELSFIADQVFSDPNFDVNAAIFAILSRKADNAQTVLAVRSDKIAEAWLNALTR